MSIAPTKVLVRGEKGLIVIPKLPTDQEVFFATLPPAIASEMGASCESLSARVQKEDGLSVEAKVFSLIVSARGRKDQTLAITFESAQPVLGAKFLEDLCLRIDCESRMLELTRLPDFAYKHEP